MEGREITVVGGTGGVGEKVDVIRGGGGIGAEFGEEDIYVDVGMRRECGLTVDGMSDATFIFPQSIAAKLCAIVSFVLAYLFSFSWRGWKRAGG